MNIRQEHLERKNDPLIKTFKEIAFKIAEKYTEKDIKNVKLELNLDKSKKIINMNMTVYNF